MGAKMKNENGGNGSNDDQNREGKVGYKSPPAHGRIKPGEVRNPNGRNGRGGGRQADGDSFEKVRRLLTPVNVNGERITMPSDEAFYMFHMSRALTGNAVSARIIAKELATRRDLAPPPPTAEELAEQQAAKELADELSGLMAEALDLKASRKRMAGLKENGLDFFGRPLVNLEPSDLSSAKAGEQLPPSEVQPD